MNGVSSRVRERKEITCDDFLRQRLARYIPSPQSNVFDGLDEFDCCHPLRESLFFRSCFLQQEDALRVPSSFGKTAAERGMRHGLR